MRDESARALDLLRNLHENRDYFTQRVGAIATFLPRNQPLYALTCFVIVPSLMAEAVHFRVPEAMRFFFGRLLDILEISRFFPNVLPTTANRLGFLHERSALFVDKATNETWPVTEAVIFTGRPNHAQELRRVFDRRTLFIANGAGHNPIVVSPDADIERAAEAVSAVAFYNQGQDCAAPNAILVHTNVRDHFLRAFRRKISAAPVGPYCDRRTRIGPLSDPKDLVRVQEFLVNHRPWLDKSTPGVIRTADRIVEPTLVLKPLREGGNFQELFAPVVVVQEFTTDDELSAYFEDQRYARNAMYVSLYGSSAYVESLSHRTINGQLLHDANSILRNTHLHAWGVERGTRPYGGFGPAASSLTINSRTICKPTLPQRDIWEWLVKERRARPGFTETIIEHRHNIPKLLRLKTVEPAPKEKLLEPRFVYVDCYKVRAGTARYLRVARENIYDLLSHPNYDYGAHLSERDRSLVRSVGEFLCKHTALDAGLIADFLYALPLEQGQNQVEKTARQREFFPISISFCLGGGVVRD